MNRKGEYENEHYELNKTKKKPVVTLKQIICLINAL